MNKKNKDKLFIGLALGVLFLAIIIFVLININKTKNNNEIILPKDEIEIAELMLVPNEKSLQLVNIDGTILDKIEGNIKFKISETNEIMYLKDNSLYTVNVENTKTEDGIETSKLNEVKILDVKDVTSFIFNDKYIAILSEQKEQDEKIDNSTKEEEKENSDLTKEILIDEEHINYNVSIIDRESLTEIKTIENIKIDDCVLNDKNFIYSVSNYLYSYDIETENIEELYLGKNVSDLDIVNNKIIVFDKFGNGKNKSLILQLNSDLTIDKATKHDALDIIEIQKEVDEQNIVYIENDETPILYMLNLDGDRETKNKRNLNVSIDGTYSDDNTIYSRGYIYTAKDGKLNIIDLKSATIYKTYDIEASFIYPIYEEEPIEDETATESIEETTVD